MIRLIAWAPGHGGKFLIDAESGFHHWRTDATAAPHHAHVAEHLGIRSAIDGIIETDGAWWVSARVPTADREGLIARAAEHANAAGLRPYEISEPEPAADVTIEQHRREQREALDRMYRVKHLGEDGTEVQPGDYAAAIERMRRERPDLID